MNGEIPGTGRSPPAGSGGAGPAARGNRTAACAAETFLRVAKLRPATSPIAAAATVTPAVTRNERRSADAVITGPPAPLRPPPPPPPAPPPRARHQPRRSGERSHRARDRARPGLARHQAHPAHARPHPP